MAKLTLILNKFYKRQDETYPVVFLLRHKSTNAKIDTGIHIPEKYWNDTEKAVKNGAPKIKSAAYTNAQLKNEYAEITQFILKLTGTNEIHSLTASDIKNKYLNHKKLKDEDFYSYGHTFVKNKAENTQKIYENTFNNLKKFGYKKLQFSDITVTFLKNFEEWLIKNDDKKEPKKTSTVSIHMRNIRAVFNAAIDEDVTEIGLYPFRKFKIKKSTPEKRNLVVDDLVKLYYYEGQRVPELARDVFFLIFYLIGINLKDLTYLTKDSVKNNRIEYARKKGGKLYSIQIEPEAKALLKKLKGQKYLINLLDHYQNYDSVKKEINKKLKVVAKKTGVKNKVSTYYARHSWATLASDLDIPKETISMALGHEFGSKTTSIYINNDYKKVDAANRKLIDYFVSQLPDNCKEQNT